MKKIIILIALNLFLFNACEFNDMEIGEKYDYTFEHDIKASTPSEICRWINMNISYRYDRDMGEGVDDYAQLPHETYIIRKGDCEDTAILMIQLLWENGYEGYLVRVPSMYDSSRRHIIVYCDGKYYSSGGGFELYSKPEKIYWMCSYPEVIWMVYNYHDFVGEYK